MLMSYLTEWYLPISLAWLYTSFLERCWWKRQRKIGAERRNIVWKFANIEPFRDACHACLFAPFRRGHACLSNSRVSEYRKYLAWLNNGIRRSVTSDWYLIGVMLLRTRGRRMPLPMNFGYIDPFIVFWLISTSKDRSRIESLSYLKWFDKRVVNICLCD